MHLVSLKRQAVKINSLDLEIQFDQGESIHSESSYKYDLDQLGDLARRSGFELVRSWFDSGGRFSFNLLAVK